MASMSDRIFRLITGASRPEVDEIAAALAARTGETGRHDRIQHAVVSKLAADRIGAAPALLGGAAWEVAGGLGSLASGQPFVNDATGFDPVDMSANVGGTLGKTPSGMSLAEVGTLLEAMRAGQDPLLTIVGTRPQVRPAGRIPAMLIANAPAGGWRRSAGAK